MGEGQSVYTLSFKCVNCGHIYSRDLPKGTAAEGRAGPCPNCGCSEDTVVGSTGQKLGRFKVIPKTEDLEKSKKVELLLEKQHERSGK
jgi:hypothetical protein